MAVGGDADNDTREGAGGADFADYMGHFGDFPCLGQPLSNRGVLDGHEQL